MNRREVVSFALSALVVLGLLGRMVHAQDMPAVTDHAALAKMYQADAAELRKKAASHQVMLERYKNAVAPPKGIPFPKEAMVEHCRKLISSYEQAAKDADEMAKMERELAQAATAGP